MNYVYRKDVLDLGCQVGYGTHLLSYGANTVTGVDISSSFIQKAGTYHRYFCGAHLATCDLETEFPDGDYDVIVAFQILEHLKNPEFAVANALKSLRTGGQFLFAVPHMMPAEEHKILFDYDKIEGLISSFFGDHEIYEHDRKVISGEPLYKDVKSYVGIATKG